MVTSLLYQTSLGFSLLPYLVHLYIDIYSLVLIVLYSLTAIIFEFLQFISLPLFFLSVLVYIVTVGLREVCLRD